MISYEYERRFLCLAPPRAERVREIVQGYLTTRKPTVRIRLEDGSYVQTVKGSDRLEVEFALDRAVGEALLGMCGRRVVRKRRFVLGPWEVDCFDAPHHGLAIAEVELGSMDERPPDVPAGLVLLREITGQARLSNAALARCAPQGIRDLVDELYRPFGWCDAYRPL
jgi:CYTH domain-containing protein